jgi:hypothetical protein
MQTFLPFPDFRRSLECLDPSRLGNQIYREALTLARGKWRSHPASKMWRGHEHALCQYALVGLDVLRERGRDYPHHRATFLGLQAGFPDTGMPPWLGDAAFHRSHQSNLIRKDPEHYGPMFPGVPDDLEYVWPTP